METKNALWIGLASVLVLVLLTVALVQHSGNTEKEKAIDSLTAQTEGLKTSVADIQAKADAAAASAKAAQDKADALEAAKAATMAAEAKAKDEAAAAKAELERVKAELATVPKSPSTSASAVDGEVIDNLFLNSAVNFVVDDQDLAKLQDGSVEFDGTDYDVHEEFSSVPGNIVVAASLTEDEDFGADPRLMLTSRGALKYSFVFDEGITASEITNDEPLEITFLGQKMSLVKVTASEVTIRSGQEEFLFKGEEVTVEGKKVKLELVGRDGDSAYVSVDGVAKVIKAFRSETVNGLDIRVEDVISDDDNGAATLVIGSDTTYRQKNNDDYFDDESFVFNVNIVGGELKSLSVSYDEKREKDDGELAALKLGEEITFPNKFVSVKFDKVLNTDRVEFDVSFDEFDEEVVGVGDVSQKCVVVDSSKDDVIEVGTTEETNQIFVCGNSKVYYQDNDGDWHEATLASTRLVNDEAVYTLVMGPNTSLRFVEPTGDFLELDTDFGAQKLGATKDEAESAEVKYSAMSIGNRENDVLTLYGTVIYDTETSGDNDEFSFSIPSDRVEAEVLVH